ncbi:MAG TPA: class I SAM-dependent methyltransferase [Terriglobales bacterium]|nr:class I SAM-dependent methyltransferase [Terriglobales bacterium]
MSSTFAERLDHERTFHNHLQREPLTYRMVRVASEVFYNKDDDGVLWGPVWRILDLHNKIVLDYGCGSGGFSCSLARRGARVYGTDISEYLVSLARAESGRANLAVRFSVGDAHRTEFPSAMFDYVFGNGILHHLDLPKAYLEIARVLKPGGKAYFMEPLIGHPLVQFFRWATPGRRTEDERPLDFAAVESARLAGLQPVCRTHYLTAVAALPGVLLGKPFAKRAVRGFDALDQVLFRIAPGLRKHAWLSVVEFTRLDPGTVPPKNNMRV